VIQERPSQASAAALAIAQIYAKLPAQDVDRARRFYAEKLGLLPYGERHNHLYYELAGAYFIVFPSTGSPSGTHDQLGLVVEDLAVEMARLKDRGVAFEAYPPPPGANLTDGITDMGQVKAAWFKDSEGNLISIAEFPSGSPFRREL
jgi:catechol 2,3-dioxygenase-like lactoylglutathione lyase family enzyme